MELRRVFDQSGLNSCKLEGESRTRPGSTWTTRASGEADVRELHRTEEIR